MNLRQPGAILLISCYELGHQPLASPRRSGFCTAPASPPTCSTSPSIRSTRPRSARAALRRHFGADAHGAAAGRARRRARPRDQPVGAHLLLRSVRRPECRLPAGTRRRLLHRRRMRDAAGSAGGIAPARARQRRQAGRSRASSSAAWRRSPICDRLPFALPVRDDAAAAGRSMPGWSTRASRRTVGYVEASRGCLHLCTHCPIPPVYGGRFFVVPEEIVLEDIRHQVRRRRHAHHVRRPRLPERAGPRHEDRPRHARGVSRPDLRHHHQGRAYPRARRRPAGAGQAGLPVPDLRRRIGQRNRAGDPGEKPHQGRHRGRRSSWSAPPASRRGRPGWPSRRGRPWTTISTCWSSSRRTA